MIKFDKFTLSNGLRVLVHEDNTTPFAAVNMLYDVGSRDEDPNRTGFAHLFEHLMFGGSAHVVNFDDELQKVGGESNAFTSNDITNYYITIPAYNIETAFWLESDRMLALNINEHSLEIQRQVVIEEFHQRYTNQPYGDAWLLLRAESYHVHPYRWPVIGRDMEHIRQATLPDVQSFFHRYYAPNNAILSVAGPVKAGEIRKLAEKWFSSIEYRQVPVRSLPREPGHTLGRFVSVNRPVPTDAVYCTYMVDGLYTPGFYCADILSDVLASGKSSRLYENLVKTKKLFSEVNAYVTADIDPGLFVLYGKPMPGISLETADEAIQEELQMLCKQSLPAYEMQKLRNKFEANQIISYTHVLNKAMALCRHELMGDADNVNHTIEHYNAITPELLQSNASRIFTKNNSTKLYYKSEQ